MSSLSDRIEWLPCVSQGDKSIVSLGGAADGDSPSFWTSLWARRTCRYLRFSCRLSAPEKSRGVAVIGRALRRNREVWQFSLGHAGEIAGCGSSNHVSTGKMPRYGSPNGYALPHPAFSPAATSPSCHASRFLRRMPARSWLRHLRLRGARG